MTLSPRMPMRSLMLAAVMLMATACGPVAAPAVTDSPPTATAQPLSGEAVVYVVASLSGPSAEQGQAQAAGARLAATYANENGGLLGQQVTVRVFNDRGTPEGTQQIAQTIAEEAASENVVGVVVSESSDPMLAAARETYLGDPMGDAPPLVVVPASTDPQARTVDNPLFFRLSAPNSAQAAEVAAAMREGGVGDVIALHSPADSSRVLAETFTDAVEGFGIDVTNTIELSPDDTDFAATAARIFEQNPAALFLATAPYESGQILSALYEIDYQGSIYAVDQALPYAVVDELGCQAEGLLRASVMPTASSVMTDSQLQRYAQQEGRLAEPFSVAGYAAIEFITAAYNGAGTSEAASAADYARANDVPTLLGDLSFSPDGQRVGAQMHFQQVQARDFATIFARTVGTMPEVSSASGTDDAPYLDEITFAEGLEPVVFADLNWNSALFHNAVARTIIEVGYEQPTRAVAGSTVPSFQRLVRGDVDVVIERYNFDDTVAEAIATGQIADLGVNFTDAVQGWFVPRYVVDGDNARGIEPVAPDLAAVDQLEDYVTTFGNGAFYGGVPGWTAHKINCMKLKAYQLDDNYAQVTSASTADLFGALASAYDEGEPILLYLWAPTSPIARYDLVQLEEPAYSDSCWDGARGCAYPTGDVRVLVSGDLPERVPEVSDFLTDLSMDIEDVSAMLVRIEDEQLTPDEAARLWLQENEAVWSQWVPEDVAARVRAHLETDL